MPSFQRLVSSAGSNTVQYVLVGENGQITPLGQPVQTQPQVRTGRERGSSHHDLSYYHYYYYQGKIRDVDLGADSSASAESEPEGVSTTLYSLLYSDDVATFLRSEITQSQSQSECGQMVLINVFFMDIIIP